MVSVGFKNLKRFLPKNISINFCPSILYSIMNQGEAMARNNIAESSEWRVTSNESFLLKNKWIISIIAGIASATGPFVKTPSAQAIDRG